MTVKELRDKLMLYPDDAKVVMYNWEYEGVIDPDTYEITEVNYTGNEIIIE